MQFSDWLIPQRVVEIWQRVANIRNTLPQYVMAPMACHRCPPLRVFQITSDPDQTANKPVEILQYNSVKWAKMIRNAVAGKL